MPIRSRRGWKVELDVQDDQAPSATAPWRAPSAAELSANGPATPGADAGAAERSDEPTAYEARPGDTLTSIAKRFGLSPEDLAAANPTLVDGDETGEIEAHERVVLPDRDDVHVMIEAVAHEEYLASRADLDGIEEDELTRECISQERQSIAYAYRRLQEVAHQQYPPRNTWDKLNDLILGIVGLVFFATLVVAVVAGTQWILGFFVDDYAGWSWARWWWWGVVIMAVLGAVSLAPAAASERVDSRYLRDSKWISRRRDFDTAVRNFVVQPTIRQLTKVQFRDPAADEVRIDSSALTTTAGVDQIIRTDTYREMSRHLARTDGATLGLRGSRGAGKSDLVRAFCKVTRATAGRDRSAEATDESDTDIARSAERDRVVGVFIAAPTSVDEFAFLRRVALLVCDSTLRQQGVRQVSETKWRERWMLPVVGLVIAAIGVALWLRAHTYVDARLSGQLLVATGVLVLLSAVVRWVIRSRRVRDAPTSRLFSRDRQKGDASRQLLNLAAVRADELRERLRYSREISENAEGGIGWKSLSAKVSRSVKVSEHPLTKDDIVEELQELIKLLDDAGYRVIIGVDELDRLDVEEDTAELLNTMKALFAIPTCSFIVTISKSAWATFEQRGLQVRTVFDSSFDDIVEATPLSFLDARSLLRARGANLSDTQVMLVNVVAGGVARDVIRSARLIADFGDLTSATISSRQALEYLVAREAQSKVEAAILDIRSSPTSVDAERAVARLDRIGSQFASYDFDGLIDELRKDCPDPSGSGELSDENPIDVIRARTISYLAFLRLIELAFSEDGPVASLAAERAGRFVDLPRSALDALENVRSVKEWLGAGCATACFRLEDAAARLGELDATPAASEVAPTG